jgi:hypothetical protein
VDRAIGFSLASTGWTLVARPVTLLLMVECLTADQQGYAVTFASVLALQVFFELGVGTVVQQFASHEAGRLDWAAADTPSGDPAAHARLASLFRQTVVWYAAIAVLTAAVILPVGWVFFERAGTGDGWQPAWALTVLAAAFAFLNTPAVMLLNGAGQVAVTARVAAQAAVVSSVAGWGLLLAGVGLAALPLATLLGLLVTAGWLAACRRRLLLGLWRHPAGGHHLSWRREVWPFQWRIALSWLSGYFIFQLFNPVAFAFHGPAAAGRVGLSLALCTQVQTVAMTWISTKLPRFGNLIARGEYDRLDREFFRAFGTAVGLTAAGAVAVVIGAAVLGGIGSRYADRLLPPLVLALPAANVVLMAVTGGLASYLRAFRREPFLVCSLVTAGVVGASTYLLGRHAGVAAMLGGFLVFNLLVGVPWAVWLFRANRYRWRTAGVPA